LFDPASPILGVNAHGDLFGDAVAAGDFNADGFTDLAVGVPGENQSRGMVYVYIGSVFGLYPWRTLPALLSALPPVTLPLTTGDHYGSSLVSEDFNADGYADLAVGIPQATTGAGMVAVFTGSARGLVWNTLLTQQPASNHESGDEFGRSLAAGDFDGDCVADLAVGAPGEIPATSANQDQRDGARFGAAMAAGRLGVFPLVGFQCRLHLVVGAPKDGPGRAFFFTDLVSTKFPSGAVRPSGLSTNAGFGSARLGRDRRPRP
jgi:hypothetical protein